MLSALNGRQKPVLNVVFLFAAQTWPRTGDVNKYCTVQVKQLLKKQAFVNNVIVTMRSCLGFYETVGKVVKNVQIFTFPSLAQAGWILSTMAGQLTSRGRQVTHSCAVSTSTLCCISKKIE